NHKVSTLRNGRYQIYLAQQSSDSISLWFQHRHQLLPIGFGCSKTLELSLETNGDCFLTRAVDRVDTGLVEFEQLSHQLFGTVGPAYLPTSHREGFPT